MNLINYTSNFSRWCCVTYVTYVCNLRYHICNTSLVLIRNQEITITRYREIWTIVCSTQSSNLYIACSLSFWRKLYDSRIQKKDYCQKQIIERWVFFSINVTICASDCQYGICHVFNLTKSNWNPTRKVSFFCWGWIYCFELPSKCLFFGKNLFSYK